MESTHSPRISRGSGGEGRVTGGRVQGVPSSPRACVGADAHARPPATHCPRRGHLSPSAGRDVGPEQSCRARSPSRWDFRGQASEERRPGGQWREPGPLQEGALGVPRVWQGNTPPRPGIRSTEHVVSLSQSSALLLSVGGTVQGEADAWVVSCRVHSWYLRHSGLLLSSRVSSE